MNPSSPGQSDLHQQVVDWCASIGLDRLLVQGAGGNVSWKEGDTLHVKASGTWLADASSRDIFVAVDLNALRQNLAQGDFGVKPSSLGNSSLRPSIETVLHALMPHRVVVHLHAIEVLAHLVRDDAADILQARVGQRLPWVLVDYKKPGAELAAAVHDALRTVGGVQVAFLKNHGVVVGADEVAKAAAILESLVHMLETPPSSASVTSQTSTSSRAQELLDPEYRMLGDADVQRLALDDALRVRLDNEWALYPDHVVFLGPRAYTYASDAAFRAARGAGETPELVFVAGSGVFARDTFSEAKEVQLRCYYDVLVRQPDPARTATLAPDEIAELLDWDAERYRMQMAK